MGDAIAVSFGGCVEIVVDVLAANEFTVVVVVEESFEAEAYVDVDVTIVTEFDEASSPVGVEHWLLQESEENSSLLVILDAMFCAGEPAKENSDKAKLDAALFNALYRFYPEMGERPMGISNQKYKQ